MTDDLSLGAITDESYDDNYYNDSYDDEYLGDGEEIDDFDEDLPDEMHLPHVFNCLQSMTKKVNNFTMTFDGTPNEETAAKLTNVVSVLAGWIDVIDSYFGKCLAKDIPYFELKYKMMDVCEQVKIASGNPSLKFGMFRLSIFTTYVTSLGMVIPDSRSTPTSDSNSNGWICVKRSYH